MRLMNTIQVYIERKRAVMMESANRYGFNSDVTIKQSQELDKLLNEYRVIISKNSEEPVAKQ